MISIHMSGLSTILERLEETAKDFVARLPGLVMEAAAPDIQVEVDRAVEDTVKAWRAAVPAKFASACGGFGRIEVDGAQLMVVAGFPVADGVKAAYGGYVNKSAPDLRTWPDAYFDRRAWPARQPQVLSAIRRAVDSVVRSLEG